MGFFGALLGGAANSLFGGGGGDKQQQQQQRPSVQMTQYDATPFNTPRANIDNSAWRSAYNPAEAHKVGAPFGSPNTGDIKPLSGAVQSAYGQLNGAPPPPMYQPMYMPQGMKMPEAPKYAPTGGYLPQRMQGQQWGDRGSQQQRDEYKQYSDAVSGDPIHHAGMALGHWFKTGRFQW